MSKKPTRIEERFLAILLRRKIQEEFEGSHSYINDSSIKSALDVGYYSLSIDIAEFIASGEWTEIECLGGAITAKLNEFDVKMVISVVGKKSTQGNHLISRDFSSEISWNADGKVKEKDFDDFDFSEDFEDFVEVTDKPASLKTIRKPKAVVKLKPKKPTQKS